MMKDIFTIGHSNLKLDSFLELLDRYEISAVADVRSVPYSRRFTQFNREELKKTLGEQQIQYVFLGKELGGRPDRDEFYNRDGVADYGKMATSRNFQKGLTRILTGAETYKIALLCSEGEPLKCHRSLLIARHLKNMAASVIHIYPNGKSEEHIMLEERLLKINSLEHNLIESGSDLLAKAYMMQNIKVAYARAEK